MGKAIRTILGVVAGSKKSECRATSLKMSCTVIRLDKYQHWQMRNNAPAYIKTRSMSRCQKCWRVFDRGELWRTSTCGDAILLYSRGPNCERAEEALRHIQRVSERPMEDERSFLEQSEREGQNCEDANPPTAALVLPRQFYHVTGGVTRIMKRCSLALEC